MRRSSVARLTTLLCNVQAKSKKVGGAAQHAVEASSSLESLSSYHHGKVAKAEAQLAALEKQVGKQEAAIKSKDEQNIQALKMEEQQAKKDEVHRLASLKAHEESMSKLLHSRIQHLKHEREQNHLQNEKAARKEKQLEAKMAAVKDADSKRLAKLQEKLDKIGAGHKSGSTKHAAKASRHKVINVGNDDKFVEVKQGKPAGFRARTQELSEVRATEKQKPALAAKTAKMDAQANKVAHMLEKSSKLQQIAIRDAAAEAKLIQTSFKKYFGQHSQSLAAKPAATSTAKPPAKGKGAPLPLQDGPRAAGFAKHAQEVKHQVQKVAPVHVHTEASTSFDSSDEKPRGFSERLDSPSYFAKASPSTNRFAAIGSRVHRSPCVRA